MIRLFALALTLLLCGVEGGMDLTNYVLTFSQDFTKLSTLDVTSYGPSTWIAHTPSYTDWVTFEDPSGPYQPFNVGCGQPLTIRSQPSATGWGGYMGGMLCSVDSAAQGFSQRYGYFEMSAKLPYEAGTWPAFWLLDTIGLTNSSAGSHEIDILEQYGTYYNLYSTLHLWAPDGSQPYSTDANTIVCSMWSGFHKYGLDIQEDYLTFYYDRQQIWQVPNTIPGTTEKWDRPMYVMVNLAYQTYAGNNASYDHADMLVEYVKVWQGYGGSANSLATDTAPALSYTAATFNLIAGQTIQIDGAKITIAPYGAVEVLDDNNNILWTTGTSGAADLCAPSVGSGCHFTFQNDGNLGFTTPDPNVWWWGANTYGYWNGLFVFSNTAPFLQVLNASCDPVWTTGVVTNQFLGCYTDGTPHDLNGFQSISSGNTPGACCDVCRAQGYLYGGVQNGNTCYCGNSYGQYGAGSSCNTPCQGDNSQTCGGSGCNDVYRCN